MKDTTEYINLEERLNELPQSEVFDKTIYFMDYGRITTDFFCGKIPSENRIHWKYGELLLKEQNGNLMLYCSYQRRNCAVPFFGEFYFTFEGGNCAKVATFTSDGHNHGSARKEESSMVRDPDVFLKRILNEDYDFLVDSLKGVDKRMQRRILGIFPQIYQDSFKAQSLGLH